MMKTAPPVIVAAALGLAGAVSAQAVPAPDAFAVKAAVIKPSPEELRWQQIPWCTSLVEARNIARAERRPIFLWVTSDPPFDRC
jgi:hypothetical protein